MKGIENLRKVALWMTQLISEIDQETEVQVVGYDTEFEDLDEQEKLLLNELIKSNLELKNDIAEEFVERIFYLIIEIGDTIDFYLQSKK